MAITSVTKQLPRAPSLGATTALGFCPLGPTEAPAQENLSPSGDPTVPNAVSRPSVCTYKRRRRVSGVKPWRVLAQAGRRQSQNRAWHTPLLRPLVRADAGLCSPSAAPPQSTCETSGVEMFSCSQSLTLNGWAVSKCCQPRAGFPGSARSEPRRAGSGEGPGR